MFCQSLALGLLGRSVVYAIKRALYFGLHNMYASTKSADQTVYVQVDVCLSACCAAYDTRYISHGLAHVKQGAYIRLYLQIQPCK